MTPQQAADFLRAHDNYMILTHVRPDGDTVGCAAGLCLALRQAGKTAFVRGIARGLGISGRVTSPTFTIVNEYDGGRLPLFHFDMYRLSSAGELYDIGWEDYLRRGGVCAVEWSEHMEEALDAGAIRVDIRRGEGEHQRRITVTGGENA